MTETRITVKGSDEVIFAHPLVNERLNRIRLTCMCATMLSAGVFCGLALASYVWVGLMNFSVRCFLITVFIWHLHQKLPYRAWCCVLDMYKILFMIDEFVSLMLTLWWIIIILQGSNYVSIPTIVFQCIITVVYPFVIPQC